MLALVINLENRKTGTREAFAFDSSPVRVGRNKLNELVIADDLVSQWHGLFRFDGNAVVYVDLGSTNGTAIDGQRVARNLEVPLGPSSVMQIADYTLRFARAAVPAESITRKPSSFMAAPSVDGAMVAGRTVMFQAGALPGQRVEADPRVVAEIVNQTQAVYGQYVQAAETMSRYLEHYLDQVPADRRAVTILALRERMAHFGRTRDFRRIAIKAGVLPEQLGDVDLEAWVKRVVFGSEDALASGTLVDVQQSMERIGLVLESFAQAFVDLRGGHEQFLQDIGLRLHQEEGGLGSLRSSRGVLAYLLDWSADGQSRVDELNRAFADIALHQVGLINGVVEGVRSVLGGLLPEAVAGLPPATRSVEVREARSSAAGFFGGKAREWWRNYARKHAELEDGDRFARDIFGRAFATAYLTIMGNVRKH